MLLLKLRLVAPVDQYINLVSPYICITSTQKQLEDFYSHFEKSHMPLEFSGSSTSLSTSSICNSAEYFDCFFIIFYNFHCQKTIYFLALILQNLPLYGFQRAFVLLSVSSSKSLLNNFTDSSLLSSSILLFWLIVMYLLSIWITPMAGLFDNISFIRRKRRNLLLRTY